MGQKNDDKDTNGITDLLEARDIKSMIYTIRGQQVMLDSDLAMLYQVETGNLNKAMKRNQKRFPKELCFELTKKEFDDLNFQNGISREHGGRRKPGYVYTEQGIAMLSAVLRSDIAICVSIYIMKTFVEMRHYYAREEFLLDRINELEVKHIESEIKREAFEEKTEKKFDEVFDYISSHCESNQKIFFDGQIYDAFSLITSIIRKASKEIILIDGYADIDTLNILAKKNDGVDVKIYTFASAKLTNKDISNFNSQYPTLTIKKTPVFHDRFIILDGQTAYHIGASIKDAGKKCFGISLLTDPKMVSELLNRLNGI